MDNRTHIIFKYKCYISKIDNKLYIITELQNITFLKYLEGIFMEFFNYYKSMIIAVLEIKKYIKIGFSILLTIFKLSFFIILFFPLSRTVTLFLFTFIISYIL